MATLKELRDAYDAASRALHEAEDTLGQARDHARAAIRALADLEIRDTSDNNVPADEIATARAERDTAVQALRQIRRDLKSDSPTAP